MYIIINTTSSSSANCRILERLDWSVLIRYPFSFLLYLLLHDPTDDSDVDL